MFGMGVVFVPLVFSRKVFTGLEGLKPEKQSFCTHVWNAPVATQILHPLQTAPNS